MSVKEVLQEIIVENRDLDVGRIVEREIKIERINKKATILMGIRRCGKTTGMFQ